jgi:hypothetical protein
LNFINIKRNTYFWIVLILDHKVINSGKDSFLKLVYDKWNQFWPWNWTVRKYLIIFSFDDKIIFFWFDLTPQYLCFLKIKRGIYWFIDEIFPNLSLKIHRPNNLKVICQNLNINKLFTILYYFFENSLIYYKSSNAYAITLNLMFLCFSFFD